jgi:hypothetical protein
MAALSVSRKFVDSLIEDGVLETKRIGKHGRWVRITGESFDRFYAGL